MSAALDKARQARKEMAERGETVKILNPMEKYAQKPTMSNAIKANCFVCVGGDVDPGGKARVADCPVASCFLHAHRPWRKKT